MIDLPRHLQKIERCLCATCKLPGGNHCLIKHIKRARRGPVRALGVILFALQKAPVTLQSLSEEDVKVCQEFVRCFPADLDVKALCRGKSCAAMEREAAALEQGLALQIGLLCGSSPFRSSGGCTFKNAAAALEAASSHARVTNVAHAPPEIGDPLDEYMYSEVLLGTLTGPGEASREISGRFCIDQNKTSWVEVETDGESRSLYRFPISNGKHGFLGETEETFGSSLVNFIILWASGKRQKFPPATQSWPRWKSLASWSFSKKDNKNIEVEVMRPASTEGFKHITPWIELALADAVREARDFKRESDARAALRVAFEM